jgi:WD40 repeat protein
VWDLESGEEISIFSGESKNLSCAFVPDGRTIIAGDDSGRVHFLQLIEGDETMPLIGDTKIPLLLREQQSTGKPKE